MIIKNWSFYKKIFVGMILAAFIPMLLGYLALIQVFNMTYENNLEQEAKTAIHSVCSSLEVGMESIYEAIDALSHNQAILDMLRSDDEQNDFLAYRELYAISSAYGDYANFCVYDAEGTLQTSVVQNDYVKDKLPLDWSVLYESAREPEKVIVRNARIYRGEEKEEFLRVAQAVCDGEGEIQGFIVAVVSNAHFDYALKGSGIEKGGIVYAMDDFHETIFYSVENCDTAEFQDARTNLLAMEKEGVVKGEEFAYYHRYLEPHGIHIFYRQSIGTLELLKNSMFTIVLITAVVSLLVSLVLAGSFSNVFYKPIKQMQGAIAKIKEGDFNAKVKVYSEDELGQLSQSINVMTERLTENMNHLIQRERELSEANIKMMQAQLNPHFIYNTLDTMKWIGKANQLPEVSVLSSGLAQIMRMSISAPNVVSLKQELELVEAYVEIQKIRFEDKFEFLIDIPEALYAVAVPKLILQPLVENAIIHGFADRAYGTILIQAEIAKEEKDFIIFVKDDGCGMPEEMVTHLNCHEAPKHQNGKKHRSIGFYNVHNIISLHYGAHYGLQIVSEPELGTTVYIRLPYQRI